MNNYTVGGDEFTIVPFGIIADVGIPSQSLPLLLYYLMRWSLCEKNGNLYYESQSIIAASMKRPRQWVNRNTKPLVDLGYIDKLEVVGKGVVIQPTMKVLGFTGGNKKHPWFGKSPLRKEELISRTFELYPAKNKVVVFNGSVPETVCFSETTRSTDHLTHGSKCGALGGMEEPAVCYDCRQKIIECVCTPF